MIVRESAAAPMPEKSVIHAMLAAKGVPGEAAAMRIEDAVIGPTVSSSLSVWRTRRAIARDLTHKTLVGIDDLIAALERLPEGEVIVGRVVDCAPWRGPFFFRQGETRPIGFVFVEDEPARAHA